MSDNANHLLNDEHMRQFIVDGYVQVQTHLADSVHDAIFQRSENLFDGIRERREEFGKNPQNNIIPMIPELRQVLEAPQVVGALQSILGDDYLLHPHRHCHPNFPVDNGAGPQLTMVPHKDGHANGAKPRHRVPRWAIVFYYPQECPAAQGPTAVIPRSQYHGVLTHDPELQYPGRDTQPPTPDRAADGSLLLPDSYVYRNLLPLESPQGAVSIMHFDIGHSVLTNVLERMRYGHKFVFMRTHNPSAPSWNNTAEHWESPPLAAGAAHNEIVWTYVWNWLRGNPNLFAQSPDVAPAPDPAALLEQLQAGSPPERAAAASACGLAAAAAHTGERNGAAAWHQDAVVAALAAALRDKHEPTRLNSLYALGAVGAPAVPRLTALLDEGADYFAHNPVLNINHAAHALAAAGPAAIAALTAALRSPHEHVRASAAYGLGEIGKPAAAAVDTLINVLADPSNAVRFHAGSALGIIGEPGDAIIAALLPMLDLEPEDGAAPTPGINRSQLQNIAVQALIRLDARDRKATAALAQALHSAEPYVAAFAGEQLRRIGTPAALRHLADALSWSRWFPSRVFAPGDREKFMKRFREMRTRERAEAPVSAV